MRIRRQRGRKLGKLLGGLLLVASACSNKEHAASEGRVGDPAPTTASTTPALSPGDDWLTYHHDASRQGVAGDQAALGAVRRSWESPHLDGKVYAQPLVAGERVLVATEGNSVYALERASGTVIWRAALGDPVPGNTLPCGNIDPSGITSTPVIDPTSGNVYAVAFLRDGPHHELFALDLASGAVRWHRGVDPPGLAGKVEQERGALALSAGRVLVPYGGLAGDCGAYKGAVVSVAADGQGNLVSYVVPTTREAGIWTPGGVVTDAGGRLFVATGNSESTSQFDYGNAVIRLTPGMVAEDYFSPANWLALNRTDGDLGSLGPLLVSGERILIAGKDGAGYLLNANALGHVGGQVFSAPLCAGAYGTAATSAGVAYVPCSDGLFAIRMIGDRFERAWMAPGRNVTSPILAGGAVWALDGIGRLSAFDPATGAVRFTTVLGPVTRFSSPAAARGTLVVATGDQAVGFTLR